MSQPNLDESFTYIVNPVSSAEQCAERKENSNLPSLSDAMTGGVDSGILLIKRGILKTDALSGFSKLVSKRDSPPGGCLPTVVEPNIREARKNMPDDFLEEVWSLVWMQFVRDINRETLLIDGVLHSNPNDALEAMRVFLDKVYDETFKYDAKDLKEDSNKSRDSIVASNEKRDSHFFGFSSAILSLPSRVKGFVTSWKKQNALTEAIRLSVLMSQQTVLALPVEILQGQFCAGYEHTIILGEPQMERESEDVDTSPFEDRRRMTIRIERRESGNRLPFVRLEKSLNVFAVDENTGAASIKLQLLVSIEATLFKEDDVELSWRWRPSKG